MNFSSIKVKVTLAILVSLTVGAFGILYMINTTYENNVNIIARESVKSSEEAFKNLETNDTNMLSSTLKALLENENYKKLFIAKDKDGLYQATSPLFSELKERYRVTHWYFHNPEPDSTCFLRVHKPEKAGDVITRVTYQNSAKNKNFGAGKELGKTAFALRVVHPYYNNGTLIGYMELGEEIDHFLEAMRDQTGNEFGLMLKKEFLDEKEWASTRASHGVRNNWNDQENVLVVNSTTKDTSLMRYDGDIARIPDNGTVLGEVKKGDSVFVRGAFPILDAAQRKVGGVFFARDITPIYNDMKSMQTKVTVFIATLMVAIVAFLVFMLNRLVIRRLNNLIDVATVVVGGDYDTQITPSANDEIGKFEALFEQFRAVFVNLMKDIEEREERQKSA